MVFLCLLVLASAGDASAKAETNIRASNFSGRDDMAGLDGIACQQSHNELLPLRKVNDTSSRSQLGLGISRQFGCLSRPAARRNPTAIRSECRLIAIA